MKGVYGIVLNLETLQRRSLVTAANFAAFFGCPKAKRLSASGGFAHLTPE